MFARVVSQLEEYTGLRLPSAEAANERAVTWAGKFLRTRQPEPNETSSKLEKCLQTRDLISLGVGSCVGTGMYLVAGMVAHTYSGPAVILSFLIAGVASLLSGVCYAEFGVRVPNTSGSAFVYAFVMCGELIAYIIGWNMILEYLIGTAAAAACISKCLDSLFHGSINFWMASVYGTFFGHVPDALAATITLLMTCLLAAGVKKSLLFNNVLNVINFTAWTVLVVGGLFYVDTDNWTHHGGFLPFGWSGVLKGAAVAFYAFIGFDVIATTGEEAVNPIRSIPTAIVSSMAIALTAYVSAGLLVTLMIPYKTINADSSIVAAFEAVGADKLKMLAVVGALAGLVASMFGSMFPMPRVVYAMAKDGLLFNELAQVSPLTNTPLKSTFIFGGLTALVAFLVSLEVLVEMMSIGTLMAYTLVSACVLLLRYQPTKSNLVELLPQSIRSACATPTHEHPQSLLHQPQQQQQQVFSHNVPQFVPHATRRYVDSSDSEENTDPNWSRQGSRDDDYLSAGTASGPSGGLQYGSVPYQHGGSSSRRLGALDRYKKVILYLFPYGWKVTTPASEETGMYVVRLFGLFAALVFVFDLLLAWYIDDIDWGWSWSAIFFFLLLVAILVVVLAISRQPQIRCDLKFKAPGVPFVPALAIFINVYLIMLLSVLTLVRFLVWMTIGMVIYFQYGVKHSLLALSDDNTHSPKSQPNTLNVPNNVSHMPTNNTNALNEAHITTNPFVELTMPVARSNQMAAKQKPPPPPPLPPRPSLDRQDTNQKSFSSSSPFGPIYDVNKAWGDE